MRLSERDVAEIVRIVRERLGDAVVRLHGSRLDDSARGGDVDLHVVTPRPVPYMDQIRLGVLLEQALDERAVDLSVMERDASPSAFDRRVLEKGTVLAP